VILAEKLVLKLCIQSLISIQLVQKTSNLLSITTMIESYKELKRLLTNSRLFQSLIAYFLEQIPSWKRNQQFIFQQMKYLFQNRTVEKVVDLKMTFMVLLIAWFPWGITKTCIKEIFSFFHTYRTILQQSRSQEKIQ
jgi:hypothetical protein